MSGVKDGDEASFMSVRVSASEALVTHRLGGRNRHFTHSNAIYTGDNLQKEAHKYALMHAQYVSNPRFLYEAVSPSSNIANTPSTIAQMSYQSVHSREEGALFQQKNPL